MSTSGPPGPLLLARVSRGIASGSARALRSASPQALQFLLASPARGLTLDAIFWHAARQLAGRGSNRTISTVRCHVIAAEDREPDTYELRFATGTCQMARGAGDAKPEVTVALDDAELVRLVTGQTTPVQGVLNGRIMVRGDLGKAAAALASVFLS
jgi:alkyl sulfatase BDS1-like metallo-beta-lactamase superfamily hydrolase